jgi:uncharacterized protein (TIGR03578 family)
VSGTAGGDRPGGARQVLRLTGRGASRKRAFADAMAQVGRAVAERAEGVPYRVEPVAVEVVDAVEHRWQERFLGLLFPRPRSRYELTLRIDVRVAALDLAGVDFAVREERLTPLQHVLRMR